MHYIKSRVIFDLESYDKDIAKARSELIYIAKNTVGYSIIYVDNELVHNVYIENNLIIADKINDTLISKILKLERIVKKYIMLGYNPPIYFVCGMERQAKIIQVGFKNKFNNCIDIAIINDDVDILVMGNCECCPIEIILPDNIELRVNSTDYNNTFIRNIEHTGCIFNDYEDTKRDIELRVNRHLVFDRLRNKGLSLQMFKNIETVEIKNTSNVEMLLGFAINNISKLILNEKITKLMHFSFDRDNMYNDLVKIITPLKEIYLNGYIATYDEKTDSYKIPNNETVIVETCLMFDKERYKELFEQ